MENLVKNNGEYKIEDFNDKIIKCGDFFIKKYSIEEGIHPVKLQKLLFFFIVNFIMKFNKKTLEIEPVKGLVLIADKKGPVVENLHEFYMMTNNPIYAQTKHGNIFIKNKDTYSNNDLDAKLQGILDSTWEEYGDMEHTYLSDLSHLYPAWSKARKTQTQVISYVSILNTMNEINDNMEKFKIKIKEDA